MRTTTKVRLLAGHAHSPRQQVIRLDYESEPLSDTGLADEIAKSVGERSREVDAAIISDYNYGVACSDVLDALRSLAARGGTHVLIDSRFRLDEFAGFTSATPNED